MAMHDDAHGPRARPRGTRRHDAKAARRPDAPSLALASTLALLPCAAVAQAVADGAAGPAGGAVAEYGEGWVAPDQRLAVRLGAPVGGTLRVFVGTLDVSAFVRRPEPGLLVVEPLVLPLPAGETELRIFAVQERRWHPVARLPLKVLTAGGFEKASTEPRLSLELKSRAAEGRSADAPPGERGRYLDLGGKGSLSGRLERGGGHAEFAFNAGGTSYRREALRYGDLGPRAPKIDLNDYRIDWARDGYAASLGHLSYGNHPLLLDGFASRGLSASVPVTRGVDVSVSALNGTAIAGSDNLLGLDEPDHRVLGATLGLELLPDRPGGLRIELSLLHASVQAQAGFDAGEVPDAQRSRGLGVRLLAKDSAGRLRVDLALARSTYRNTADPQLEVAGAPAPMPDQTRNGYIGELAYDLLADSPAFSAKHPLKLSLQWRREQIAPLYRSLGASLSSDRLSDRVGVVAAIAGAQFALQHHRREDNLDRVATLLKTGDRSWELRASLPLPAWMGGEKPEAAWPALNLTRRWHTQRALNAPPVEQSGFAATHLPDQANASFELGANWTGPTWSAAYALAHADQDNRQPGRERADTSSLTHQLSATRQLGERLALNAGLSLARQHSREQGSTQRTRSLMLGADWRPDERWTLGASANLQRGHDSLGTLRSDGWGLQGQVARSFEIPWIGSKPLPAQVFVRYGTVTARERNSVFGSSSTIRQWGLDAGLSITVF